MNNRKFIFRIIFTRSLEIFGGKTEYFVVSDNNKLAISKIRDYFKDVGKQVDTEYYDINIVAVEIENQNGIFI